MVLLLGQLIYTSFSQTGFRALSSAAIPAEIRQAFLDRIVYQSWDAYNPPDTGYHAAYLYRVAPDQTLFGWLYNDGVDDFDRSHIPYFVSYYFAGQLTASHLEAIFTCLAIGPVRWVDRQALPDRLSSIAIDDYQNYRPARPGVMIPPQVQEQSYAALQQGKLFKLLMPVSDDQSSLADWVEIPVMNTSAIEEPASSLQINHIRDTGLRINTTINTTTADRIEIGQIETNGVKTDEPEITNSSEIRKASTIETYHDILAAKLRPLSPQPTQRSFRRWWLAAGAVWLIAHIGISVYLADRYAVTPVPPTSTAATPDTTDRPINPIADNPTLTQTLTDHTDAVWSVLLSADGKTLYSGSADRTIKRWNIATGAVLSTLTGHRDVPRTLALTPDQNTLISGSGDRTIRIWDLPTNQLKQTLELDVPVWSIALSPDGQTLLSGGEDGILRAWRLETGTLLYSIPVHRDRIFSVIVSPDGQTIATASLDGTLKVWDAQTQQLLQTMSGHTSAVRALAFGPDGQTIASASWDQTLKLWNWQTGELLHTLTGHRSRAVTIAFSPDGQTLVSGSIDNTVKLWSVADGTLLRTLPDATDWVLALAIDADHLVSGSKDRSVRIWRLR